MVYKTYSLLGTILHVQDNDALTDFTGLQNLQSIGTYLRVFNNDALTDFNGLQNLQSIGNYSECAV